MTFKGLTCGLFLCLLISASASAQDTSHVFRDQDVERMKAWSTQNARSGGNDCLETLNENLKLLFNDRGQRLGSTVDLSMASLQGRGRAAPTRLHEFFDDQGRPTTGVTEPKTLRESVWDDLAAWAGDERGYFGFGLSPLDGNHSVLLFLDNRDPADPNVYWVDQWGSKGGWKLYDDKAALDGEIEKLTNSWWKSKLSSDGIKFRSRCRLYPLIPAVLASPNRATMSRVPLLRMRSGPGTSHEQVRDANGERRYFRKGETFEILGREGQWAKLLLSDGSEAWGHVGYMRLFHVAERDAAEAAGVAGALGALE